MFNILQIFGYISGFATGVSYVPYIKDILQNKTKPQRASWLIWTVLGIIAFFSQLAKGATDSLWMTGIQCIGITLTFLLSIKFGVGGLNKKDYVALIFSAFGLVAWYFTKEAAFALYIVILIDMSAGILTIHKAYLDPTSETLATWALNSTSASFAALAVGGFNFVLLSYPLYTLVLTLAIISAIFLGKRRLTLTKVIK